MKKTLSLILVLASSLLFLQCSTGPKSGSRSIAQIAAPEPGHLQIATVGDLTAIDPHYQFVDLNINLSLLVYEALIEFDQDKKVRPLLATTWRQDSQNKKIWRFKLRNDVVFHNGEKFTKDDVLATIDRIMKYEKHSKGGFAVSTRNIDFDKTLEENKNIADVYELAIVTKDPAPLFLTQMGNIFIMSKGDCEKALAIEAQDLAAQSQETSQQTLQAFANGSLTNGTGPYRFQAWIPGNTQKPLATVPTEIHQKLSGSQ